MIAGDERGAERHDAIVHPRPDRALADLGVDVIGEVDRGRALRQVHEIPAGSEHEDFVLIEPDLQILEELVGRRRFFGPLRGLPHDGRPGRRRLGVHLAALLVGVVRGDTQLGDPVHLPGADLHLDHLVSRRHHRRVQRLIHVALRRRDIVGEAVVDRGVEAVHGAERLVTIVDRGGDDADPEEVEDLFERPALILHLLGNRVEVLRPARDLGLDPHLHQLLVQAVLHLFDEALALEAAHLHLLGQLAVELRVQVLEGEVLELPLDGRDPQPVGERRVDVERLARDLDRPLALQMLEGAHVVQPVGELDEHHPHVLGHRQEHLAEGVGLLVHPVARC